MEVAADTDSAVSFDCNGRRGPYVEVDAPLVLMTNYATPDLLDDFPDSLGTVSVSIIVIAGEDPPREERQADVIVLTPAQSGSRRCSTPTVYDIRCRSAPIPLSP